MLFPEIYYPGMQNIYFFAAYMNLCVLHGILMLGATFAC